jgi:hypothetical protein
MDLLFGSLSNKFKRYRECEPLSLFKRNFVLLCDYLCETWQPNERAVPLDAKPASKQHK